MAVVKSITTGSVCSTEIVPALWAFVSVGGLSPVADATGWGYVGPSGLVICGLRSRGWRLSRFRPRHV